MEEDKISERFYGNLEEGCVFEEGRLGLGLQNLECFMLVLC